MRPDRQQELEDSEQRQEQPRMPLVPRRRPRASRSAGGPLASTLVDYADLDRRMRSAELTLAIEIPPGFGRDLARRRPVQIGAWIDGAMPQRGEIVRSYVQAMHAQWLAGKTAHASTGTAASLATVETRFRYNPDVESLVAMVPAVIPLLLLLIPAMLTALSVVREKELGSIVNFYVTPVTRLDAVPGGRRGPPVRCDLIGNLPRHHRPLDAAVRPAADAGLVAAADAVRRRHPSREHARRGAGRDAGRADDAFRHAGAGDPLSWRRPGGSLAAVPCPRCDRRRPLRLRLARFRSTIGTMA